jgi:collagenase-like PrtC family protease
MSLELVCPAGSLPALRAAVDNGADCVYIGFRGNTNARAFAGLNFDLSGAMDAVRYVHARGKKVLLALNTYPEAATWQRWQEAVDQAAEAGVDAVILADAGLMRYASRTYPGLRLHLSVARQPITKQSISTMNISAYSVRYCPAYCLCRRWNNW